LLSKDLSSLPKWGEEVVEDWNLLGGGEEEEEEAFKDTFISCSS
jgi:hypothetical protein